MVVIILFFWRSLVVITVELKGFYKTFNVGSFNQEIRQEISGCLGDQNYKTLLERMPQRYAFHSVLTSGGFYRV
jgi:hypothetical protein